MKVLRTLDTIANFQLIGSMKWIFQPEASRRAWLPVPVVWFVLPHGTSALVAGLTRPAAQNHGCGVQELVLLPSLEP
eukprot:s80_g3.t1